MYIILTILITYYLLTGLLTRLLINDIPEKENRVYYCCYKKYKSYGMFIRASLGAHVCSSALIINGCIYRLKKDKIYMQKEPFTLEYLKSHYYVLDTGYNIDVLGKDWEEKILSKKRLNKDKLFQGFNCLRNCSCILNQLPKYRVYRYEIFTSIYVLRLILTGKWKLKKKDQ